MVASFMLLVVFVAGEILSRSRAGLGLTIIALLGAFVLAYSDRRARSGMTPARLLLGLVVLTALLLVQLGLYRVLERFADDPLADGRIPFARNTIEAALAFFPIGSGLGTFTMVYPTFEKTRRSHGEYVCQPCPQRSPGAVAGGRCGRRRRCGAVRHLDPAAVLSRVARGNWGTRSADLLLARAASIA